MTRSKPARALSPEKTLEFLEGFASPAREASVAIYLVAAFWPWWLTFLVVSFLLWQTLLPIPPLAWATAALAVLAGGGWLLKQGIERWATRRA